MPSASELERAEQEREYERIENADESKQVDAPDFIQFAQFQAPEPYAGEMIGIYHRRVVDEFQRYVNQQLVPLLRLTMQLRG